MTENAWRTISNWLRKLSRKARGGRLAIGYDLQTNVRSRSYMQVVVSTAYKQKAVIKRVVHGVFLTLKDAVNTKGFSSFTRVIKIPWKTVIKRVVHGVFLTLNGEVNTKGFSSFTRVRKTTWITPGVFFPR